MRVRPLFRDRADAGRKLARHVVRLVGDAAPLVLAIPRGGVPVAVEVALALRADLDIFLVRKLGLPGQEELAIGAIASGGLRVLNRPLVTELQLSSGLIDDLVAREEVELKRREALYREGRPPVPVTGRAIVLVDDGLATGTSMRAAVGALRTQEPKRIAIAVPVASKEAYREFRAEGYEIVCPHTPDLFGAVGFWYQDFTQTTDAEVRELLQIKTARLD